MRKSVRWLTLGGAILSFMLSVTPAKADIVWHPEWLTFQYNAATNGKTYSLSGLTVASYYSGSSSLNQYSASVSTPATLTKGGNELAITTAAWGGLVADGAEAMTYTNANVQMGSTYGANDVYAKATATVYAAFEITATGNYSLNAFAENYDNISFTETDSSSGPLSKLSDPAGIVSVNYIDEYYELQEIASFSLSEFLTTGSKSQIMSLSPGNYILTVTNGQLKMEFDNLDIQSLGALDYEGIIANGQYYAGTAALPLTIRATITAVGADPVATPIPGTLLLLLPAFGLIKIKGRMKGM